MKKLKINQWKPNQNYFFTFSQEKFVVYGHDGHLHHSETFLVSELDRLKECWKKFRKQDRIDKSMAKSWHLKTVSTKLNKLKFWYWENLSVLGNYRWLITFLQQLNLYCLLLLSSTSYCHSSICPSELIGRSQWEKVMSIWSMLVVILIACTPQQKSRTKPSKKTFGGNYQTYGKPTLQIFLLKKFWSHDLQIAITELNVKWKTKKVVKINKVV